MSTAPPSSHGAGDDERGLLAGLEQLLDREEQLLAERDTDALHALADERDRLTERLHAAARRRAVTRISSADETELIALYTRLRQRHDVRARVIRLHTDQASRALGVLAQASGQAGIYNADGRIARLYGPA